MDGLNIPNMPLETRVVFNKYKLTTFQDRMDYVKTSLNNKISLTQFKEFLNLAPLNKPFFLQLGSDDPHRPLNTQGSKRHDPSQLKLPSHYPDTKLVREDFARYYDEISHFDDFFGEVMSEIDARSLTNNTIVVFMGDNGCSQFRGKGTLYEFGIHVPLIVRWPGCVAPGS